MNRRITVVAAIVLVLSCWSSLATAQQWIVTTQQAERAFAYARRYVENDVAYRFGGRLSVEGYLEELAAGKEPGTEIGVDSSALVINAYRSIIPNLLFWGDEAQSRKLADVSSSTIYHFNAKPLELDDVQTGDLVFFKDRDGRIMGTGLFSHRSGSVVHFITASANAGKVILTNTNMNGSYWQTHFAGFGRLQYTLRP